MRGGRRSGGRASDRSITDPTLSRFGLGRLAIRPATSVRNCSAKPWAWPPAGLPSMAAEQPTKCPPSTSMGTVQRAEMRPMMSQRHARFARRVTGLRGWPGDPRHGRRGDREAWRPAGLPQADRRAERPPPILESRNDDPRLRDMALETALWRRILNADQRGPVLIGACTSDIGVHVHRNVIPMCAPALPYVAGCLAVGARPPERRRRSGACGRRRERPPYWGCLDRHRGGVACARPCHPPPGGSLPTIDPCGKALER